MNTDNPSNEPPQTPGKSPWPLGITLFYVGFAVVLIGYAIVISRTTTFDLVSKNYYAEELAYQDRIDARNRVAALPESPTLTLTPPRLVLAFPTNYLDRVEGGLLHLYRPSDSKLDQMIPLEAGAKAARSVDVADKAKGLWKAKLRWRMDGEDYYLEETLILPGS